MKKTTETIKPKINHSVLKEVLWKGNSKKISKPVALNRHKNPWPMIERKFIRPSPTPRIPAPKQIKKDSVFEPSPVQDPTPKPAPEVVHN